jgi:hypothetical protein
VRVLNKTSHGVPIELRLEHPPGDLQVLGGGLVAPPQKQTETSVLIELDRTNLTGGKTLLVVGVYSNGRKTETLKTGFVGPRDDSK